MILLLLLLLLLLCLRLLLLLHVTHQHRLRLLHVLWLSRLKHLLSHCGGRQFRRLRHLLHSPLPISVCLLDAYGRRGEARRASGAPTIDSPALDHKSGALASPPVGDALRKGTQHGIGRLAAQLAQPAHVSHDEPHVALARAQLEIVATSEPRSACEHLERCTRAQTPKWRLLQIAFPGKRSSQAIER